MVLSDIDVTHRPLCLQYYPHLAHAWHTDLVSLLPSAHRWLVQCHIQISIQASPCLA